MTIEEIDAPGPIIKKLLINQDAEGLPADEFGQRIFDTMQGKNCAFAKVEPWWMNEEVGSWQELIFFHSDFETDDAYHITRVASSGFMPRVKRDSIKKEGGITGGTGRDLFMPKSIIQYGYHAGCMERDDMRIYHKDGTRRGTISEADITLGAEITVADDGRTYPMVKVHSPYEAKEDIKDLDYGRTLRRWSDDEKCWLIRKDSVNYTLRELIDKGHEVALNQSALRSSFVGDIDVDP